VSVQDTVNPSQAEAALPTAAVEPPSRRALARLALGNVRQFGMLAALLLGLVLFQFTTGGVMLKSLNVTNIFLQNGYIMVMVLGMLLVIVIGHIDLSVGSVAAFTGAVAAVMMTSLGLDPVIAVVATLALGGLIGVWQGFWIAYLGVPSFIVTLAGMLLFRGLTLWMLGGQPIGPFDESFRAIASGFFPEIVGTVPDPFGPTEMVLGPVPVPLGGGAIHLSTLVLGALLCVAVAVLGFRSRREQIRYGFQVSPTSFFVLRNVLITIGIMFLAYRIAGYNGLPIVALIAFILVGVYMFLTLRTVIGRRIYAVGGNAKAAMLSGVNSRLMVFLTFVNMGVLAALGGLIIAARFNSATPKAGYGFELDVIAATFVGGASMYGGIGSVAGAVIGALFFGVLNIGMGIMSIPIDYQFAIKALVLLAAVFFDVTSKGKDA
jgi:putative multiple sugar transport system permease protein